jgi:hypothetical protein
MCIYLQYKFHSFGKSCTVTLDRVKQERKEKRREREENKKKVKTR